jgi:hypothetical protein
MTADQKHIVEKIESIEAEENFLIEHQSWGAAEGANHRKCCQIDRIKGTCTPEQVKAIELIQANAFLAYLAKGVDYMGPYPSAVEPLCAVLEG